MTSRPLADRFWEKVDVRSPSECWEWTAGHTTNGYGHVWSGGRRGKNLLAHRVSHELNKGTVPQGMHVLHSCHNPGCVNPAHLRLGTHEDNMTDRQNAGRQAKGVTQARSKLSENEVELIAALLKRIPPTSNKKELGFGINSFLGRWFGVGHSAISVIGLGKNWRHINVVG